MKQKTRNKRKLASPKSILRLPDLEAAKSAVLNSLSCPDAQRGYRHAIDEFVDWYCSEPRLSFNKTVVTRYRMHLEFRGLAPGTINLRLGAVRRLAYEAADCGLLSADLAAGIRRVKGVKKLGVRLGNWLTAEQAQALWQAPDCGQVKGKRDRALLAVLLACGLRRHELAKLTFGHLQQREGHWAIVDLRGKAGHVRTIPVPDWVYGLLKAWTTSAGITMGSLFRRVSSGGRVWGEAVTEKLVWHVVKEFLARSASASSRHMISAEAAPGFAELQAASWSRFSSCLAMFPCRPPNATLAAPNGSHRRSMTASESSRILERCRRKSGRRYAQRSA
jgi:site-specific recombinase XerD